MPQRLPVASLIEVMKDARDGQRPTGLGFALADSIRFFDREHWGPLAGKTSLFLSRSYLTALEQSAIAGLRTKYALVFREEEPVAAVAAQVVTIAAHAVDGALGTGFRSRGTGTGGTQGAKPGSACYSTCGRRPARPQPPPGSIPSATPPPIACRTGPDTTCSAEGKSNCDLSHRRVLLSGPGQGSLSAALAFGHSISD